MQKIEAGTYSLYTTEHRTLLQVFQVTQSDELSVGKWYFQPMGEMADADPRGPFDTEDEALEQAYQAR